MAGTDLPKSLEEGSILEMKFRDKKLPMEALDSLRACPIKDIVPYELTLAPCYVRMPLNEKLISVKGPLDFFSPQEIDRLMPFETLFIPPSEKVSEIYQIAGRKIRDLLLVKDSPAPFLVSDSVVRILGPLWNAQCEIEPFFVSIFVDRLCDPIPRDLLQHGHNRDLAAFDHALISSSWVVFLALHLGYCDLDFLSRLRQKLFLRLADRMTPHRSAVDELEDLAALGWFGEDQEIPYILASHQITCEPGRTGSKLRTRMERVRSKLQPLEHRVPSIYGPEGFGDG